MICCFVQLVTRVSFIGELRDLVEGTLKFQEEQVIRDKINCVHWFFEDLDVLCNFVKGVNHSASLKNFLSAYSFGQIHQYIEGRNALLLLYKVIYLYDECFFEADLPTAALRKTKRTWGSRAKVGG